ncbi:arginine--tRNA ligase [Anaerorhabdus furcosa]|uniref:Arginine--tRNA ligase n=1 Tax=Anaerorhabdus furcosa TaxID=118967 RepID=A0A1T4NVA7_9FIRM|nr:arginine--tRNA ligase [Anaerorhabdus furcosa]SJZ83181.1 arginyl-tRNA synthetase [Anaerorhabdus furcosa]
MNKIEQNLTTAIKDVVTKLYGEIDDSLIMIEIPKDNTNGDYSTNIAMRLAKVAKKAPAMIAREVVEGLKETVKDADKIEIAGPGFINFWMKKSVLADIINVVLDKGEKYGENTSGDDLHILVEYVSANPTGDLHLGHARGAAWGDCICRLLNKSGYNCLREYYINDAGAQMINLGKSVYSRYAETFGVKVDIPEDGYQGPDVAQIGKELAEELGDQWLNKEEGRIEFFKEKGREKELEKIKKDLQYYGCEFDSWISEQSLYDNGSVDECIEKMKDMGLTFEEDGALWFKSTKWGDDKDRVLRKSDGTLTYLTPDIANHMDKFARGYTKLVNLWGADHHGYIPRMVAAIQAMGYGPTDLEVDIIQMVRLVDEGQEVKMSKRTGNAITIRELCDDIGVDAARYFFVSRAVDTHLDFDLGLARKKTNENPVYYAQYAHARMCSILRNAPEFKKEDNYDLLVSEKEVDLLKYIAEFTSVVADAAATRSPNKICNYVQKLAGYFHSFYGAHKIIDDSNPELTNQRLGLLLATKQTLANALDLIGISAPEKM